MIKIFFDKNILEKEI